MTSKIDFHIGMIGYGIVGMATASMIDQKTSKKIKFHIHDPGKNRRDPLGQCDAFFISVPVDTLSHSWQQDLKNLRDAISVCPPGKPVFVRSTVLPGTCDEMAKEFNREIFHIPEFLTERQWPQDAAATKKIFVGCSWRSGADEFLRKVLHPNVDIQNLKNMECELLKYAHNSFGMLKILYFNGINEICEKYDLNYARVKEGFLSTGFINKMHTQIPGPDGKKGAGGKCLPKDAAAFSQWLCEDNRGGAMAQMLLASLGLNGDIREPLGNFLK